MGRKMNNVYYQTKWAGEAVSFWGEEESLGQLWLQHGLMLFFDGDIFTNFFWLKWIGGYLAIAFIFCALFYLIRHTALNVWSFLIISSSIIYLPLATADIFLGGRRSGVFRYLSSSLGAIEIAVAFCLVSLGSIVLIQTQQQAQRQTQRQTQDQRQHQKHQTRLRSVAQQAARWAIVLLLIGGALSQTIAKTTYSIEQQPLGQVASIVNQTPNALLLSDAPRPSLLLPLAHLLKAGTPLKLTVRPDQPVLKEAGDRPIFLYLASEAFQARLIAQGNRLQPVAGADNLLSVERSHQVSHSISPRSQT